LGIGILHHQARLVVVMTNMLVFAILGDDVGQIALLFRDFPVRVGVCDDRRIGHLARQTFKARLDIIESLRVLHYAMTSSPPCRASSAMAPSKAWIATAVCSSDGGCVVTRCSQS